MDFYQRVGIVCRAIPAGKVATYGQIALLCGKPRNARQVGYALNRGRAGADVPAFRVVNGQGVLSGAQAFSRPNTQKKAVGRGRHKGVCGQPGGLKAVRLAQHPGRSPVSAAGI